MFKNYYYPTRTKALVKRRHYCSTLHYRYMMEYTRNKNNIIWLINIKISFINIKIDIWIFRARYF